MRITPVVIIGRHGQLARELADLAWPTHVAPHFLGREVIDPADLKAAGGLIAAVRPAAIINAAAFTAVDLAESQPAAASALNTDLPAGLAHIAASLGIPFVHFSSDYVFAGNASRPYREDDRAEPASIYGQSKLAGEQAVLKSGARATILRSAGLFGRHGQNFLKTMIARAGNPQPVTMVSDQVHTPTPAAALATIAQRVVIDLIGGRDLPPLLHLTGQPAVTWLDFTDAIFEELRLAGTTSLPTLQPISLQELSRPAPRPRFSALDCSLATSLGLGAPDWRAALPTLIRALAEERIAA